MTEFITTNILFFFLIGSLSSFAQSDNEILKGHWAYCEPDLGYSECLIGDSTIDWMNTAYFNSAVAVYIYRIENNSLVQRTDGQNDEFSQEYEILDEDHIIIRNENKHYSLTRLTSKVLNFYDYDCSFKMSGKNYNEKLKGELAVRQEINKMECVIPKKDNSDKIISGNCDDDMLEEEFLPPNEFISKNRVSGYLNKVKILNEEIDPNFKNNVVSYFYNSDSTVAGITIDAIQYCYANHDTRASLNDADQLEIKFRSSDSRCKEKCIMRFEMELQITNYEIDKVVFVDE